MGVLGFREALSSSTRVLLPLGRQIDLVSLPVLLVLNVLAWADRKARARGKQGFDIAKTECEPMIEPNRMANDFRGRPMNLIRSFHPFITAEIGLT
jgi:hypothetical protein